MNNVFKNLSRFGIGLLLALTSPIWVAFALLWKLGNGFANQVLGWEDLS